MRPDGNGGTGSVPRVIIEFAPCTTAAVAAAMAADTEPARFLFRTSSALFIFFKVLPSTLGAVSGGIVDGIAEYGGSRE